MHGIGLPSGTLHLMRGHHLTQHVAPRGNLLMGERHHDAPRGALVRFEDCRAHRHPSADPFVLHETGRVRSVDDQLRPEPPQRDIGGVAGAERFDRGAGDEMHRRLVVGAVARFEPHVVTEQLRQQVVDLGIVAAHHRAVGEREFECRRIAGVVVVQKSCGAGQQQSVASETLRTRDVSGFGVDQRPQVVAAHTVRFDRCGVDPFSSERFHRITPHLIDTHDS